MKKFLSAALAACLLASASQATLITRSYSMTMTFNYNAPYTTLHANFSLTFDNNASTSTATTSGLTIAEIAEGPELSAAPSSYAYNKSTDALQIGNYMYSFGAGCYLYVATSYCLTLSNTSSANPTATFYYEVNTGPSSANMFNAQSIILTPLAASSGVPEPASWALMIGGFGMVGSGLRRQRRRVVFG